MNTIIGKDNYLFLKTEVQRHTGNIYYNHDLLKQKYLPFLSKLLVVVFPDKCILCKNELPDNIQCNYRDGIKNHKEVLQNNLLDGFEECKNKEMFYITDSHMNLLGAEKVYKMFVKKMNELFNLEMSEKKINIKKEEVNSLSELNLGIGDLTWKLNLGDQIIKTTKDYFFHSEDVELIFCRRKISNKEKLKIFSKELKDITNQLEGQRVEWNNVISPHILFQRNEESKINKKVLIFYDSFLLNTLSLYLEIFKEVFMIKAEFNSHFINIINPDYVIEFRVERFL